MNDYDSRASRNFSISIYMLYSMESKGLLLILFFVILIIFSSDLT